MSLNRSEQMVFDYVQRHPDERHYWQEKVRTTSTGFADEHSAVMELELLLWRYFVERSAVVSPFRESAQQHGMQRTSMRNLAEHLIRIWLPPKKKAPARPPE